MESVKDVMMEDAALKNELSQTISENDASMSPEREKKPVNATISSNDIKTGMSLNKIESSTTAASLTEPIFRVIRKNIKKVTF